MTNEELEKIIADHQHWLKEDCEGWEGMRADLRGADLHNTDLHEANLRGAVLMWANLNEANLGNARLGMALLTSADLRGANLGGADLRGANLHVTDLRGADLSNANLNDANLFGANLMWANLNDAHLGNADLCGADLRGADLRCTYLSGANLIDANLDKKECYRLGFIVDEPIPGYKKTREGVVITASIPKGAIVFCINGRKCRTNRAIITDTEGMVLHSRFDEDFEYTEGMEINIANFNCQYNVECAPGFHFFRTRKEAEEYDG